MKTKQLFLLLCLLGLMSQAMGQISATKGEFLCGYSRTSILALAKGQRPAPHAYLDSLYILHHLQHFEAGAAYLVPKDVLDRYGRERLGRADGQFVMAKTELDALLLKAAGNLDLVEKELGIPAGTWKGRALVRIDVLRPRDLALRVPNGNEAGANELWLPGGFLPTGYREAVVNPILVGQYNETAVDLK